MVLSVLIVFIFNGFSIVLICTSLYSVSCRECGRKVGDQFFKCMNKSLLCF